MRAQYDSAGNIILSSSQEEVSAPKKQQVTIKEKGVKEVSSTWKTSRTSVKKVVASPRSDGVRRKIRKYENTQIRKSFPHFRISPFSHFSPRRFITRKRITNPRLRFACDAVEFSGTFVAVFLFLFVALNFGSFSQVFQARLLPDVNQNERRALQAMTDPLLRKKLLSVPRLPMAGKEGSDTLQIALSVAPNQTRLIIPKLGMNVPVVEVAEDALAKGEYERFEQDFQHALKDGPAHYPGTAVPGQIGNAFITGHSSYNFLDAGKYKDVFAILHMLEVGDEYSIYFQGNLHRYRVTEKFEVSPRDVTVLDQPSDRKMSTLMTCTPLGTNLRRLIFQADEVDPLTGELLAVTDSEQVVQGVPQWGGQSSPFGLRSIEELPI